MKNNSNTLGIGNDNIYAAIIGTLYERILLSGGPTLIKYDII